MTDNLETYRRKRNFRRTPEPQGEKTGSKGGRAGAKRSRRSTAKKKRPAAAKAGRATVRQLGFVVQRHAATRLHYDFRLEHDGVLKSWAVPKEPSYDPKDRRLAVRTEDHPLDYAAFEGEIPKGEYGGGTVVIWDRGRWEPRGDPARGLEDGKLDFELHGDKLEGRWTLVRMAQRGARKQPENWLLIKRSEDRAAQRPARTAKSDAPRSVPARAVAAATAAKAASKRPAKSPASRGRKSKSAAKSRKAPALDLDGVSGARRVANPRRIAPQLATLVERLPDGDDWLFEPKLDGYRLLCRVAGGRATLLTRRGHDWTDRFEGVAAAASALPCESAILDGEAVVFDRGGLTSFQQLQNAIAGDATAEDSRIVLVAFDLLYLNGWDLRDATLLDRKRVLRELLNGATDPLRYGDHVTQDGATFYREACKLGLEGVIAKRGSDRYRGVRTKSWLKLKCMRRQEFAIAGYTDPKGSRAGLGALLLATRDGANDALRYAGKVGTGFDERTLRSLKKQLEPLVVKELPVERDSTRGVGRTGVHWVEPKLVAEISFGEWTHDRRLRHPVFLGLREDKTAAEVTEERATATPARVRRAAGGSMSAHPAPKLTNPDRVLFPDPGITKRELADYWEAVADVALPSIANRPLTLYRCPGGYAAQCFYQKHVGVAVPESVARVAVTPGEDPYAMVDGLPALLGLVQIGVLELHVWGSTADHLDQPDVLVLDLDPADDVRWRAVADAAVEIRARLKALGLTAFLRLTGGKGVHLVVPVQPGPTWPAVKKFTRAFVDELVRDEPKRFTGNMAKSQRGGKIFLDYLRNDHEATAVASYSPRARAGAPIALPIAWDELDRKQSKPPRFGLREVPAILRARKRDPWEGFEQARTRLA